MPNQIGNLAEQEGSGWLSRSRCPVGDPLVGSLPLAQTLVLSPTHLAMLVRAVTHYSALTSCLRPIVIGREPLESKAISSVLQRQLFQPLCEDHASVPEGKAFHPYMLIFCSIGLESAHAIPSVLLVV